jgi:acyl-CoA synthetase (NDP forming)
MEAFANQADMDVIVSRYTLPRTGPLGTLAARVGDMEAARTAHPDRLFVVLSRTSDQYSQDWEWTVREKRIPFVQGYGRGLRALGRLRAYSLAIHGPRPEPPTTNPDPEAQAPATRVLGDQEARELLAGLGLPIAGAGAQPGIEIRLGMGRDHQFGPFVTFGLGGLLADVSDDVATRLAPVTPEQAAAMLDEIHGHRALDAGRGRPAVDRAAIWDALGRLSELALNRPDVASVAVEAVAGEHGLTVTDARVQMAAPAST